MYIQELYIYMWFWYIEVGNTAVAHTLLEVEQSHCFAVKSELFQVFSPHLLCVPLPNIWHFNS